MLQRVKPRFGAMWSGTGGDGGAGGGGAAGGGAAGGGDAGGDKGGGGAGGGAGGDKGGGAGSHWATTANLPPELQSHGFVKNSKDLGDFVKQSVEAQGLIGRKGVLVPAENAPAAEWDAYYNGLGRPEKAEGYKFPERKGADGKPLARPEYESTLLAKLAPSLHKAGASQKVVDGLASTFDELSAHTEGLFKKYHDDAQAALDKDWGDKKPENLAAADRFARKTLGDQYENAKMLQVVGGGFLLDNPLVAKAFAAAGMAMREDGFVGNTRIQGGDPMASPEDAKAYVDKVYAEAAADPKHWKNDPNHPDFAKLDKHLADVIAYQQREERRKKSGG